MRIDWADDARGLATGFREYRTEKDIYARIRAYGIANGADTNGPLYFKVWTKSGQIYEYGAAPSAEPKLPAKPARVVTVPNAIFLMLSLVVSATYTTPAASTAIPPRHNRRCRPNR